MEHQLSCLDSTVHVQLTCYPASPQRANAPTFDSTALGTCPAHPPVLQRLERHPLLGNPAPNVNDVQSTEPAGRRAGSQHQQAWQQRPGAPTQQSRIPAPPCPAQAALEPPAPRGPAHISGAHGTAVCRLPAVPCRHAACNCWLGISTPLVVPCSSAPQLPQSRSTPSRADPAAQAQALLHIYQPCSGTGAAMSCCL